MRSELNEPPPSRTYLPTDERSTATSNNYVDSSCINVNDTPFIPYCLVPIRMSTSLCQINTKSECRSQDNGRQEAPNQSASRPFPVSADDLMTNRMSPAHLSWKPSTETRDQTGSGEEEVPTPVTTAPKLPGPLLLHVWGAKPEALEPSPCFLSVAAENAFSSDTLSPVSPLKATVDSEAFKPSSEMQLDTTASPDVPLEEEREEDAMETSPPTSGKLVADEFTVESTAVSEEEVVDCTTSLNGTAEKSVHTLTEKVGLVDSKLATEATFRDKAVEDHGDSVELCHDNFIELPENRETLARNIHQKMVSYIMALFGLHCALTETSTRLSRITAKLENIPPEDRGPLLSEVREHLTTVISSVRSNFEFLKEEKGEYQPRKTDMYSSNQEPQNSTENQGPKRICEEGSSENECKSDFEDDTQIMQHGTAVEENDLCPAILSTDPTSSATQTPASSLESVDSTNAMPQVPPSVKPKLHCQLPCHIPVSLAEECLTLSPGPPHLSEEHHTNLTQSSPVALEQSDDQTLQNSIVTCLKQEHVFQHFSQQNCQSKIPSDKEQDKEASSSSNDARHALQTNQLGTNPQQAQENALSLSVNEVENGKTPIASPILSMTPTKDEKHLLSKTDRASPLPVKKRPPASKDGEDIVSSSVTTLGHPSLKNCSIESASDNKETPCQRQSLERDFLFKTKSSSGTMQKTKRPYPDQKVSSLDPDEPLVKKPCFTNITGNDTPSVSQAEHTRDNNSYPQSDQLHKYNSDHVKGGLRLKQETSEEEEEQRQQLKDTSFRSVQESHSIESPQPVVDTESPGSATGKKKIPKEQSLLKPFAAYDGDAKLKGGANSQESESDERDDGINNIHPHVHSWIIQRPPRVFDVTKSMQSRGTDTVCHPQDLEQLTAIADDSTLPCLTPSPPTSLTHENLDGRNGQQVKHQDSPKPAEASHSKPYHTTPTTGEQQVLQDPEGSSANQKTDQPPDSSQDTRDVPLLVHFQNVARHNRDGISSQDLHRIFDAYTKETESQKALKASYPFFHQGLFTPEVEEDPYAEFRRERRDFFDSVAEYHRQYQGSSSSLTTPANRHSSVENLTSSQTGSGQFMCIELLTTGRLSEQQHTRSTTDALACRRLSKPHTVTTPLTQDKEIENAFDAKVASQKRRPDTEQEKKRLPSNTIRKSDIHKKEKEDEEDEDDDDGGDSSDDDDDDDDEDGDDGGDNVDDDNNDDNGGDDDDGGDGKESRQSSADRTLTWDSSGDEESWGLNDTLQGNVYSEKIKMRRWQYDSLLEFWVDQCCSPRDLEILAGEINMPLSIVQTWFRRRAGRQHWRQYRERAGLPKGRFIAPYSVLDATVHLDALDPDNETADEMYSPSEGRALLEMMNHIIIDRQALSGSSGTAASPAAGPLSAAVYKEAKGPELDRARNGTTLSILSPDDIEYLMEESAGRPPPCDLDLLVYSRNLGVPVCLVKAWFASQQIQLESELEAGYQERGHLLEKKKRNLELVEKKFYEDTALAIQRSLLEK